MMGEPGRSVIGGLQGTELPTGATGTVALRTSEGRRQFQFSVSAVEETTTNDEGNPVTRTVLLEDITDRKTREQRLTVLNRILRHNVRNDLDVVLAYDDHVDDEELRTGIRARTTDLLELSNKVREAEEVMTESTDSPESFDLTDVASTVVDRFRSENESADISLVYPDEVTISSHRAVLRQVLFELVENSLEHTTADAPCVELSVREVSDGTVELSVADDGPGSPEREREILAAGTGHDPTTAWVSDSGSSIGQSLSYEERSSFGRTTPRAVSSRSGSTIRYSNWPTCNRKNEFVS
jgi:signal transduction histidine kinase